MTESSVMQPPRREYLSETVAGVLCPKRANGPRRADLASRGAMTKDGQQRLGDFFSLTSFHYIPPI